jgi:large subunit ribosomal protein L31e
MGTSDVRLDVKLDKHIWSLYSYVTVAEVPPEGFVNLGTKVVDEDD